jgi:alpha-amylase/alpha-mannosidase (GH57 family)
MPSIRLVILWHMHQPYYKDLVTGEYRLPWVRLHALKDYYGMVKLAEEFPDVHMTFNLVPSLVQQVEDYAAGTASDPMLTLVRKPAEQFSNEDKIRAVQYLFQANPVHLIGRFPRYRELYDTHAMNQHAADKTIKQFTVQDFTDLQVLSQLAWFDEFHLEDHAVIQLLRKGRRFNDDDRLAMLALQEKFLKQVLPAYQSALQNGGIEISTSPFYHPILPLLCDTHEGALSSPGLRLPQHRFVHPDDAKLQIELAKGKYSSTFGYTPSGMWPSEGSISEAVLEMCAKSGISWMASDEGVLARSIGHQLTRDAGGVMDDKSAKLLYRPYRFHKNNAAMDLLFRDRSLSDLIGFVYSGMPPADAAKHFIARVHANAASILAEGRDAVVPVVLDGENCWEYYPQSGREFLRQLYRGIHGDPQIHACTVSEALAGTNENDFGKLDHIVPGSWINANFDIWIGSDEDRRSWDLLSNARDYFTMNSANVSEKDKALAFEELLIAEGSDWNWWYGPEHHSANDADFDELYRKHLANVYSALGSMPPEALSQPIAYFERRTMSTAQSGHITPRLDGEGAGFFDWMGAAHCRADHSQSAMHGKQFLLDCAFIGQDDKNFYLRLDFTSPSPFRAHGGGIGGVLQGHYDLVMNIERHREGVGSLARRLSMRIEKGILVDWKFTPDARTDCKIVVGRVLIASIPLEELQARRGDEIRAMFSIWQDGVPMDVLPDSGWLYLAIASHDDLSAQQAGEQWIV